MEKVSGKLKNVIWTHPEKGVCIACYHGKNGDFTVTGSYLPAVKRATYIFDGEWIHSPKYGLQFKAASFEEHIGTDKDSIAEYLSSGKIKGIGKTTAKKIVDYFGTETLDILDRDFMRIVEVKGISKKKANHIRESYLATRGARQLIMEFGKHGLGASYALRAYDMYGAYAEQYLRESPYKLCEISGISFQMADALGPKNETYERNPERFVYAANFVLSENENGKWSTICENEPSGSTAMKMEDMENVLLSLLRQSTLTLSEIHTQLQHLIENGVYIATTITNNDRRTETLIQKKGTHELEAKIAERLHALSRPLPVSYQRIENGISLAEEELCITLCEEQKEAVIKAFTNGLSLIVGPPGTGKTTEIQVISYVFNYLYPNKDEIYAAPSGKAASRMRESTGKIAHTAYSRFHLPVQQIPFPQPPECVVSDALVVIDEVSMLDIGCACQLFSSIDESCIVVLCGDDEQLPSVSAGAVLRDMIESTALPVTVLRRVYRQAQGSTPYENAMTIRRGSHNLTFDDDFQMCECETLQECEDAIVTDYLHYAEEYGVDNVMVLSPFKKNSAGVHILNRRIQDVINPPTIEKAEFKLGDLLLREGDIVLNLKNTTNMAGEPVVNGDVGKLLSITKDDDGCTTLRVIYPHDDGDIYMTYTENEVKYLTLGYAFTVHKAQGSQAKVVLVCTHMSHYVMLKRNVYYTAITRAKLKVVTYGQKKAVRLAIDTVDTARRRTTLKEQLQNVFGIHTTIVDENDVEWI